MPARAADAPEIARLLSPYYLYQATANPVFFAPIFFVYYQERAGLAVPVILWLQAYAVGLRALLDFPFGALADRYSRRACLAASSVGLVVGSALLVAWPGLGTAMVAETLFATASALKSGADSALLFDALDGAGALAFYARAEGRGQAVGAIASGTAAVAGGVLAAVDLRLPYLATAACGALSALFVWRLTDSPHRGRAGMSAARLMLDAWRQAEQAPAVRWVMALAAFTVVTSHVYFYLQQPYLRAIGVPVAFFGLVFAATKVLAALVASGAHHVDRRVGAEGATAIMATAPAIGFAAMSVIATPVGAVLVLTRGVLDGLWQPLVNVYMNRIVDSRLRATMLSLQSLVARLALAVMIWLLGVATARTSVAHVLAMLAMLTAIAGGTLLIVGRRLPAGTLAGGRPCDTGSE